MDRHEQIERLYAIDGFRNAAISIAASGAALTLQHCGGRRRSAFDGLG
jgi:hypothetical protein